MADKKRKKSSGSSAQNNPFKVLKGFSVSEPKPTPISSGSKPVVTTLADIDEPESFTDEMAKLGVKRMAGVSAVNEPIIEKKEDSEPLPKIPVSDEELFVEALGKLDTVFSDQYPDDDEASATVSPRRMKQLRQGKLAPEANLDLHGLTRDAACNRVRYFLENAVYHGMKTVLVVTGWGKGSEGNPVLRGEVETYLSGAGRTWVAEWGRAPRRYGGDGALVVFLKTGGSDP